MDSKDFNRNSKIE